MILAAIIAVALQAGTPARPAPDAGWPQGVALTAGVRYELFGPWFSAYDGAVAEVRHAVVRTDGAGAQATGEVTLRAAVEPGPLPGELELLRFEVTGLVLDGRPVDGPERSALSAALSGRALWTTRQAVTHDLVAIDARAAVETAGGPAPWTPAVVVSERRALALGIDGDPVTEPLTDTGWLQVANTPWVILVAPDGSFWVLCGADRWMQSARLDGGYAPTPPPPAEVCAALGVPASPGAAPDPTTAPAVFVVTQPTVAVWTQGAPAPVPVAPGVEWVPNAGPLLLRTPDPEAWWTLVAGTWLRADRLDAPWSSVAPSDVPSAFALLPGGRVLGPAKASVPHTPEAAAAVAAAAERRTITVRRDAAACAVTWSGAPEWQDVPGTPLRLASNASRPVLEADRRLWCCDDAVWFTADDPDGPWSVADALPDALDSVPEWSAAYPLSFVEVQSSDDASVTFAYRPGYFGTRIAGGTACFGPAMPVGTPGGGAMWTEPAALGVPLSFDPSSGTFGPAWTGLDPSWRPAVRGSVRRAGWGGWGVSPSFTAAWATCIAGREASSWPELWPRWTPGSTRWADARTAAARRRDAADRAEVASREPAADVEPSPPRITDDERAWRRRVAEAGRRARAVAGDAGAPRLVPVADPGRVDAPAATTRPARGTSQWWYRYINDYTHGFLSRANGYRDPRAGAVDARDDADAVDGNR